MAGGHILREALIQGYDIRALARTPAKLDVVRDRIAIIQGDARDPVSIQELLTGSDVVLSALGPVRAGELARFMVEQIAMQGYIRKGPFLGSL